jgi:hypothetical protein
MINTVSWLLGLSGSIIVAMSTLTVAPKKAEVLSFSGMAVSVFALYIVWVYDSHEKWNRRKADRVVESEPELKELLPSGDRPKGGAGVFGHFGVLSVLSLLVQIIVAARR